MSDVAALVLFLLSAASGYGLARAVDHGRRLDAREQHRRDQQAAFLRQRRVMLTVQERAELNDLRDYARRRDA